MNYKITLEQIKGRGSSNSYSRGLSYYKDGMIYDTVQEGAKIAGRCAGSDYQPYHVTAQLGESAILYTSCTCPYDMGGDCKHIIALLLTYLHQPENFDQQEPVAKLLADYTKKALIDLITEMVNQEPELRLLIKIPRPEKGAKEFKPVNVESFKRQARQAIENYDYYEDSYRGGQSSTALHKLVRSADKFKEQGDWLNATQVYSALIAAFMEQENFIYQDEDGELMSLVDDLLKSLVDCLLSDPIREDSTSRKLIFETMIQAYAYNYKAGGYDLAADVPDYLSQYARLEDVPFLRQSLKKHGLAENSHWDSVVDIFFHLDLLENKDPEAFFTTLEENGNYRVLISKLLEMQRHKEALAAIKKYVHNNYQLADLMPSLIAYLPDETALLVSARLKKATLEELHDIPLLAWLLEYYEKNGDKQKLYEWYEWQMQRHPSLKNYQSLKQKAQAIQQWESSKERIISFLEDKKNFYVLTQVYLEEELWDKAWAMLPLATSEKYYNWGDEPLSVQVARKTAFIRPKNALDSFITAIHGEIAQRNRDHYALAAEYLGEVREIYRHLNQIDQWQSLFDKIRNEYKRLPALQDELRKAKL